MPVFGYLPGLVTPAMMTVCINKSSSNFLLSLYLITAGKTRHGNGSVSCEYPDIPENEGNTTDTIPVQFSACRSFRRTKKGRAGTVCQRSARTGTRRDCCKSFSFVSKQFLRAFDTARKLSQTPYAERCGGKVSGLYRFSWVSVVYCWGFVRIELIAKAAFLWYNNMDRQAKIIFLPAACAASLCVRKAALCLNTALANPCKQVCSLALWKHKQTERFHITEK